MQPVKDFVERIDVFRVLISLQDVARQILILQMHLKVAVLLNRPLAGWICGARRHPNASRLDLDEDEEVEIDHAFDRPLSFRRKVTLPHRGGVSQVFLG